MVVWSNSSLLRGQLERGSSSYLHYLDSLLAKDARLVIGGQACVHATDVWTPHSAPSQARSSPATALSSPCCTPFPLLGLYARPQ